MTSLSQPDCKWEGQPCLLSRRFTSKVNEVIVEVRERHIFTSNVDRIVHQAEEAHSRWPDQERHIADVPAHISHVNLGRQHGGAHVG